jgi:hypothetical protein
LKAVAVKLGIRGTRFVEILEGLSAQDVVASPTQAFFKDGLRVRALQGSARSLAR